MSGVLDLLSILVCPNDDVLFVGPDCILYATDLFFSYCLAEPGGGHLRVKSQGLVVAVDGLFQTSQGSETAPLVVPGHGTLGVEFYGPVETVERAFPVPQVGKLPCLVPPPSSILGRGLGRNSL
jgi:hypothetical protein